MAIIVPANPALVPLEVCWQNFDGSAKLDVVATSVIVYHRDNTGVRVTDLASSALVQDVSTSVWARAWLAPTLPAGNYVAQYTATDAAGATGIVTEPMIVTSQEDDLGTVLDALLGRQKLDAVTNQWTLYRRNGSVLAVFSTKDDVGNPSAQDVFERVP